MMMVYAEEVDWEHLPPEQIQASIAAFAAFHNDMAKRGNMQFAERLQPSATATQITVKQGQTITTDGPFAESKEQMGGIYIFDCQNLDEAIEIAARIPAAQWGGTIEIRPIMEPDQEMLDAHDNASL
jgi:hypothetical protein